jgi:hypothetical protein
LLLRLGQVIGAAKIATDGTSDLTKTPNVM